MRIIVTGAGGFLGRHLTPLLRDHEVVALDRAPPSAPPRHVTPIEGDIRDPACLHAAFARGCDAAIHLAVIPGGAAEQDPALAKAVNIDATMALVEAAAATGARPRLIFASSIAVLGDILPAQVDDSAAAAPTMIYGAHKTMMEQWIATMTRRGAVDGVSLRLPGLVARPPGPSGMKSAFLSELFHALRAERRIALPVGPDATVWLMSGGAAARALVHALTIPSRIDAIALPALRIRMRDLIAEVARQADVDAHLVSFARDPAIEAAFGRYPPLVTEAADALGFTHDGSLEALVENALAALAEGKAHEARNA
jgi:nucleoside-diphosphate-sugar epimerase